jgi:hypothetical protein
MTDQPAALQKALDRQEEQVHRFFCRKFIESQERHLKECRKARCVECRDAKALIPYYREYMEQWPDIVRQRKRCEASLASLHRYFDSPRRSSDPRRH